MGVSKYAQDIKYMQKEIGKQGKAIARIDERTGSILKHLDTYVTKDEFGPYKKLTWLIVGVILSGAIVSVIAFL